MPGHVSAFARRLEAEHRVELWQVLGLSKLGGLSKFRVIPRPILVSPALWMLPNLRPLLATGISKESKSVSLVCKKPWFSSSPLTAQCVRFSAKWLLPSPFLGTFPRDLNTKRQSPGPWHVPGRGQELS